MDLSKLDDQVVDIVTAWYLSFTSGHSAHGSFYYAHRILPEPAATVADQLYNAMLIQNIDAFQELLTIPSRNLQLLNETFLKGWSSSKGITSDAMRELIDRLWENHSSHTKPALTGYSDILEALKIYYFDADYNARKKAQDLLLSLGDHLIPYLHAGISFGFAHTRVALFVLLKKLGTDGAVNILRRYAATHAGGYSHYPMAAVILDGLGLSYEKPDTPDDNVYCWDCGKRLSSCEEIVRTDLHSQAVFCSIEHLSKSMFALTDWV